MTHESADIVELQARDIARAQLSVFRLFSERDAIVVLRDVPEIHELGASLLRICGELGGPSVAERVALLMRNGDVPDLETLSTFYRAFRRVRDGRYISCLFSDLVSRLGLPQPILVDTGYCRMVTPEFAGDAVARPDLFDPAEFAPRDANDAEQMIYGAAWGQAHRDIDARHYHYQINFWFPLHDVDADRSLLLFPEAYRRDVPQYEKIDDPDRPDDWGYGRALSVPLRFGDTLLFHSQQLHASPSRARHRSRFTVELRVAAACIDDNAQIYRRLFWRSENFQAAEGAAQTPAAVRAGELAKISSDQPSLARALSASTAHAVVHRLFHHGAKSLEAGYLRGPPNVFDDAASLSVDDVRTLSSRLASLPAGEDLYLLMARLAARKGHLAAATDALGRVGAQTESYFWALEAGRIAVDLGARDLAIECFRRARTLAMCSAIALDRYTLHMPKPRSPGVPQLLPDEAIVAADALELRLTAGPHLSSTRTLRQLLSKVTGLGRVRQWLRRQALKSWRCS
jgi:hypothetical protein